MIGELAVLVGPIGGVVLAPLMMLVLIGCAFLDRRMWPVLVGGALAVTLAASTWLYWRAFWRDWTYLDNGRVTPTRLVVIENASLGMAVIAFVGLTVSAVVAGWAARKSRSSA